jgi:hypothetical protein
MINSFQKAVNYSFTKQNSTDFLELIDFNIDLINNDIRQNEQQISTTPTFNTTTTTTQIPSSIYDSEKNYNDFDDSKHQHFTYWRHENQYVVYVYEKNKDLDRRYKDIILGGEKGLTRSLVFF